MLETLSEHNYNRKYSYPILVDVKNKGELDIGEINSPINVIKIIGCIEKIVIQLTSSLSTLNIPSLSNKIIIPVKNHVHNNNSFKILNCSDVFGPPRLANAYV